MPPSYPDLTNQRLAGAGTRRGWHSARVSERGDATGPMRHLHTVLKTRSPLARYQPPGRKWTVSGAVVLLETGAPDARRRHAIVLGQEGLEALRERARELFGDERLDSVELVAEQAWGVEVALRRDGWRQTQEEPALVMEGGPDPLPVPPTELEIRRALAQETLDDFYAMYLRARRQVPSVAAIRDPRVALLVGYVGGEAVATARVLGHGEAADIVGVFTREQFRRHGYGTAMTWAAVAAARGMGATAYLLTATEMGYPVYLKMGFERFCTLRTLEPPSTGSA
jgi:GNAT superfamily N-acetyltransferase